jgi:hypothetical protein
MVSDEWKRQAAEDSAKDKEGKGEISHSGALKRRVEVKVSQVSKAASLVESKEQRRVQDNHMSK